MPIYKDVSSLEVVGYTVPEDGTFADGVDYILEKLDAIPKEDVEPVRHGHWVPIRKKTYARNGIVGEICTVGYTCSECGHKEDYEVPYCNCGAKMDEEESKNETR